MAEQAFERIQRQLAEEQARRQAVASGATGNASAQMEKKPKQLSEAVRAGIAAGNINITDESADYMELSGSSRAAQERNETLESQLKQKKQARQMFLPTDDDEVKRQLRKLEEPICLFGEGPADRRDRLRMLLAERGITALGTTAAAAQPAEESKTWEQNDEVWYHEGPTDLLAARRDIFAFSMERAQERLRKARLDLANPDMKRVSERQSRLAQLRTFSLYGSQVVDTRPIAHCRFSPDSSMLATASWSGAVKIWGVPSFQEQHQFRGHSERVSGVAWHPHYGTTTTSSSKGAGSSLALASCDVGGTVHMWNLSSEEPIHSLTGHDSRVARIAFHPSGRYLGATCFDYSWRLWDVEKRVEVLHQEGHSRAVYGIAFHPDGSLAGTTSLDGYGRVWDLRSGKNIMVLQGHVKQVLGIDFSPNGYHAATCSEDNTVRIWDLRKRGCVYTLPAHKAIISDIRYHGSGDFLVTSSYDNTAKIWTAPDCNPLRTLSGHEAKVMSVDVAPDASFVATSCWDRTVKLWAAE